MSAKLSSLVCGRLLSWLFASLAASVWLWPAHADQIDDIVAAQMSRQHIPGLSIAIVKDGKVVKERGYGLANVEHSVPVTPSTVFQSGSVAKQFTAALTMLLVDDQKIRLDEPISRYLPEAPENWAGITLRHLLNHTSGLPPADRSINLQRDYSDRELLASMAKLPLLFAPGEKMSYSNLGYQLLGMICSSVGGKFYGDQLGERIFAPLGMEARIINERDLVPNRAAGYDRVGGRLANQEWVAPSLNRTADGSLYLTAHDLARWSIALDEGKVLSRAAKEASWTPAKLSDGSLTNYGFGWELGSRNGHRYVRHRGAWQGFTSYIVRYHDDRLSIIVLANRSRARPQLIGEEIAGYYVADLKIAPPSRDTMISTPIFLRGSMNEWNLSKRFKARDEHTFDVEVILGPGQHRFRVAAENWSIIDFGAPIDEADTSINIPKPLQFKGDDLVLKTQGAAYLFRLELQDPSIPVLSIHPIENTG